jgi:hypothetical protein
MKQPERNKYLRSLTHRWITGLFGAFLIVTALVIVLLFDGFSRAGPFIGALCCAALGGDAVVGALRNRVSILERIGPLP